MLMRENDIELNAATPYQQIIILHEMRLMRTEFNKLIRLLAQCDDRFIDSTCNLR